MGFVLAEDSRSCLTGHKSVMEDVLSELLRIDMVDSGRNKPQEEPPKGFYIMLKYIAK
jgi:hypothetical protein